VAMVAALVKTQGQQRFTNDVLTNPSGFTGIDGVFRFRGDGSNQRGLAVMKVTQSGAQVIAPAPRNFNGSAI
jgi:branched-chain amino acid transport system substrate-binding protein